MTHRAVEQLIDAEHDAWVECKSLLSEGSNELTILDIPTTLGEQTLYNIQVTTRSYLGAIAYKTGGILVDYGWIKLLGSAHPKVYGDLTSWNGLSEAATLPVIEGIFMIAYDVSGGFFALNGGRLEEANTVFYFAPDCLEWEDTELSYSEFIQWLAEGDLGLFYETCRFDGWKEVVLGLEPEQVLSYYPPLWTKEGSGSTSDKRTISIAEAWRVVTEHS
ncbi:hypothetical protein D3C77_425530 [compost metagenome]